MVFEGFTLYKRIILNTRKSKIFNPEIVKYCVAIYALKDRDIKYD